MATATGKEKCSICPREKDIYECKGCRNTYCFNHLSKHREDITEQFTNIEDYFNSFRQTLNDQKHNSNQHPFIEKIDLWEYNSIQKIKQTADQCKQKVIKYMNKYVIEIENKFNDLFEQLKQIHKENEFNEIDLKGLTNKLNNLKEKLNKPSNISIEEENSSSFINKISVIVPFDKGKYIRFY